MEMSSVWENTIENSNLVDVATTLLGEVGKQLEIESFELFDLEIGLNGSDYIKNTITVDVNRASESVYRLYPAYGFDTITSVEPLIIRVD